MARGNKSGNIYNGRALNFDHLGDADGPCATLSCAAAWPNARPTLSPPRLAGSERTASYGPTTPLGREPAEGPSAWACLPGLASFGILLSGIVLGGLDCAPSMALALGDSGVLAADASVGLPEYTGVWQTMRQRSKDMLTPYYGVTALSGKGCSASCASGRCHLVDIDARPTTDNQSKGGPWPMAATTAAAVENSGGDGKRSEPFCVHSAQALATFSTRARSWLNTSPFTREH